MHRILTAVFVLAAFAAGAVEITTDTTVSVSADSAESYEIAGGATLTFSVASGATFTLSGAITGDGAVRKDGAGELVLSNSANSFSGGLSMPCSGSRIAAAVSTTALNRLPNTVITRVPTAMPAIALFFVLLIW